LATVGGVERIDGFLTYGTLRCPLQGFTAEEASVPHTCVRCDYACSGGTVPDGSFAISRSCFALPWWKRVSGRGWASRPSGG